MIFEKYHALGNDYLVYNPSSTNHEFSCEETVRICHRNFGLGSDGILVGPLPSDKAEFGLRILNPDGSEAEKSGNVYLLGTYGIPNWLATSPLPSIHSAESLPVK
jgi:diaminopimelate epimerase